MRDNNNYIYRKGTTPNTRVVVSQKNKVYSVSYDQSSFSQIGVMSSFDVSGDSKDVEVQRGVGYGDQIAELVPGVTDAITLEIERQLLYLANLHQVLGYKGGVDGLVRSIRHHQWPFDIKQETVFSRIATEANVPKQVSPASDGVNEALITFFEACWMTEYTFPSFEADAAAVTESASVKCTDILDGRSTYGELASDGDSTGNNPFADKTGGSKRFGSGVSAPTI